MSPVYDPDVGVINDVVFGARFGNGANDSTRSPVTILHQLAYIVTFAVSPSA